MSQEYYNNYLKIQNSEIGSSTDDALQQFAGKKLQTFLNGVRRAANSMGDIHSEKIKYAVERTVKDVSDGKKVMIYSGFKSNGMALVYKELVARNIQVAFIDGGKSVAKRGQIVEKYNKGDIKVLLITLAGAEGIDLKETRTVMLLDPWWNVAKLEQIVGRAVRYRSHVTLPKEQRNVDILYLVLTKPEQRDPSDTVLLSADEYLYRLGEAKMKEIAKVYDAMREAAAEKCKTMVRIASAS